MGSAGDTISVTPITARKYLKIFVTALQSGQIALNLQFNGDSGNNYAFRVSTNGGADGTSVSQSKAWLGMTETSDQFHVFEVVNITANEKLVKAFSASFGTAGAGNAPTRLEGAGKWANTAAQITRVDAVNTGTGDFATGSQVVVIGHD